VISIGMLRAHWRDMLATLIALSLGIAISTAALVAFASAKPSVPASYAGAAAIVQAPAAGTDAEDFTEYLPWDAVAADRIAGQLAEQPGVAAAVPVRTFYAQLVLDGKPVGNPDQNDPDGRSWSTASLAPYRLSAGHAPTGPGQIVVSDNYDVKVGQRISVLTVTGEQPVDVVGEVNGPGIYFADQVAASVAGGSTLIGLVADSGTGAAALARSAASVVPAGSAVLTGQDRQQAEPEGAGRTRYLGTQLLTLMLALTCFAAIFVVSQTLALATAHRRRDVALLRAVGATPGQMQRLLMREAALLGLLGSMIGLAIGALLAPLLGRTLVATGLEPVGFEVTISPMVLLGLLLGPVLAVAATWTSARHASAVSPLEAIRFAQPGPARLSRWRLLLGVLSALGTIAATYAATTTKPEQISSWAATATVLAVIALTALGPVVLPPMVRVLTWPLSRSRGATGMLVRGGMTTAVARTTSTMAPVLATVALATLVLGYVDTGRSAFGGEGVPASATAVVAPDGTPGLAEDTVTRTLALAGGESVDVSLSSQVFAGTAAKVTAAPAVGRTSVPAGSAIAGSLLAHAHGWQAGSNAVVVLPDGVRTTVRIARIDPNGATTLALNRALVRAHDATSLTSRIVLSGTDVNRLLPVARAGVQALTPARYAVVGDEDEYRLLRLFVLVALGLALGYTLLSIANTLLMATAGRVRDLGLLRLSGASPAQVRSVLFGEALTTVALGSLLGLVAGLAGVLGIRSGLARQMHTHVALAVPWGWLALLVVLSAVLAGTASVWPTWRMLRSSPAPMTQQAT
jgi:putative ABC transport system permease protein